MEVDTHVNEATEMSKWVLDGGAMSAAHDTLKKISAVSQRQNWENKQNVSPPPKVQNLS